jgi:hypothetical protein
MTQYVAAGRRRFNDRPACRFRRDESFEMLGFLADGEKRRRRTLKSDLGVRVEYVRACHAINRH